MLKASSTISTNSIQLESSEKGVHCESDIKVIKHFKKLEPKRFKLFNKTVSIKAPKTCEHTESKSN